MANEKCERPVSPATTQKAKRDERKRRMAEKEEEFIKDEFLAKLVGIGQEAAEKWIRPDRHRPGTINRIRADGYVKEITAIIDDLVAERLAK